MATTSPTLLTGSDAQPAGRSRPAPGTLLAAMLFGAVLVVSLSRNLFDPPGFDQAYYQYATERVMAGDKAHALYWAYNGMGSYVPHYLATVLFGTYPWSIRVFDACWQLATFALLIWLGGRDGGRWRVGWAAATIYAMVYYGSGYLHTAQRESFAVLPLLVLVHAVLDDGFRSGAGGRAGDFGSGGSSRSLWRWLLAGAMGLFAFSLKPTLGMCYGAVWLLVLLEAVGNWRAGGRVFVSWAALTAGFVLAALAGIVLLFHLGLWSSYADAWTLGGQMPSGYVRGPALVGSLLPYAVPALVLIASSAAVFAPQKVSGWFSRPAVMACRWAHLAAGAALVFGLLLLNHRSEEFRGPFGATLGLLIPGVATVLIASWSGRSRVWRLCVLMAAATFGGVGLQGWFFVYHMLPFFAFLSYLAAGEIVRGLGPAAAGTPGTRAWMAVCLAGLVHLSVSYWGHYMTFATSSPYVLAGTGLVDHYTRITKHRTRYPSYGTSHRVAERIRSLTRPDEPIALLFREPRIYQLAQRPPAHPLLVINEWTTPLFDEFLAAVGRTRPKVVVARIPESVRGIADRAFVEAVVLADVESFFGDKGRTIREQYRLTEVIDDVGILQPRTAGRAEAGVDHPYRRN
ncbi:MAG TPA: hypothetical protein PKY77_07835 [Phycisphaerae bacterium]|nr:hypothetical protein [Phycisphaerae bacterium]HRY66528.1 hypothetical protein [Phycisphaerae bacterium]HSA28640.1 hypothetical protein [Phycisphaerae bacterium]